MSPAKVLPWRQATLAPVVLVFGPQDFFADRAIKSLKQQFAKGEAVDVQEIDASDYVAGSIFELASSGLFGETKIVVFEGVETCSDALITDGLEFLNNPGDESLVIFRHTGKSVRGKKLLEAIRASDIAVEVTCLEFSKDAERIAFVEGEFNSNNRKIQKQAAVALAEIFGKDLEELAAACSQLQLDDAGEITEEIVNRYFGGRLETTSFKIADSALAGNAAESLLLLRHALDQGVEGVMIVSAFGRKIGEIARVIGNPRASAASLGVADWIFNRIRQAAAGWTEDSLVRVINEIAETDYAIKGGAKDTHYALEKLVRLVSSKGRSIE